jgi:hypothetical protein
MDFIIHEDRLGFGCGSDCYGNRSHPRTSSEIKWRAACAAARFSLRRPAYIGGLLFGCLIGTLATDGLDDSHASSASL